MGNRVSIAFVNNEEKSVALFNHWGGMEFVKTAEKFATTLKKRIKLENLKHPNLSTPLTRLEPSRIMVRFIHEYASDIDSIYLRMHENDGDNSDNGHHNIKLN